MASTGFSPGQAPVARPVIISATRDRPARRGSSRRPERSKVPNGLLAQGPSAKMNGIFHRISCDSRRVQPNQVRAFLTITAGIPDEALAGRWIPKASRSAYSLSPQVGFIGLGSDSTTAICSCRTTILRAIGHQMRTLFFRGHPNTTMSWAHPGSRNVVKGALSSE